MKAIFRRVISTFLCVCLLSLCFQTFFETDVDAAIKLNIRVKTIKTGESFKLKLTGTSNKVTWTTSNKAVAKVSKNGKVTGVKAGTAKITAKAKGEKYVCKVTVKPYINKTSLWLAAKQDAKLVIKGANNKVKWYSNNKKVATVSKKGLVVAKKKGNAVIKAVVGNRTFKCKVTVWDAGTEESIKYIQEVVERVNKAREKKGIKKLKINPKLCEAAMVRAEELTEIFDHTRPNNTMCFTVFREYGFEINSYKGENIAYGYVNPEKVMEGWMNSEGHRKNILGKNFEEIGVGVVNKNGYRYWVQLLYGL